MMIAGEASGDALAAELVTALRGAVTAGEPAEATEAQPLRTPLEPHFFGVGGTQMAAAGVEIVFDLANNAVFGAEALARLWEYKRRFHQLLQVAIARQPDAIVCVDFGGFNRRFAHAVKQHVRRQSPVFHNWNPRIIQYVSPQVWASRPGRADKLAADIDLLLTIFPFEKDWYAQRTPAMPVRFVGHPVVDRYASAATADRPLDPRSPVIALLPGSRPSELKRHLPVYCEAMTKIRAAIPGARARMVIPEVLRDKAVRVGVPAEVEFETGSLGAALTRADVAIAKSGTVTLECACFGVPSVVMYRTSWVTYAVAKCIVDVKYVAMPNLLADEEVFPEFLQSRATAENIARATLELINDGARRNYVKAKLKEIVASLGTPGASRRAAEAIVALMNRGQDRACQAAPGHETIAHGQR